MRLRPPVRGVRRRLLLIVLVALALGLALGTFGFNTLLARTTTRDTDAVLHQRAEAERTVVRVRHGRIEIADQSNREEGDSRIWIFQGQHLLQGPSGPREIAAARSLTLGKERSLDQPATDSRFFAEPVRDAAGRRIGTVVAGVSLAPYEQTRRLALIASSLFALTLLAAVSGAVWWLLRSALRPVAQMTEQAATWSEHDLDRRFELGDPHDELTQLGATLDGLLDRIAASLRHERRFSAELSHELRTPLAKVLGEAELALRRERTAPEYRASLEVVQRNAQQLARIVEALVAAAQAEGSPVRGVADAYAVAREVVDEIAEGSSTRSVTIDPVAPGRPLRVGVDADLVACVLRPVLENACRYGAARVGVRLERRGSSIVYLVTDDGPGVAPDEQEAIFEPGHRGSAAAGIPGAGLGLSLARRLARSAAGDVTAQTAEGRGAFAISLPAA